MDPEVHKLLKEYPDYSLTTVDVSSYPSVTEVPWFGGKVVCAKCGRAVGASTCGQIGKRSPDQLLTGPADRLCRAERSDGTLARRLHRQGWQAPRHR
jgi:hypothetical protein